MTLFDKSGQFEWHYNEVHHGKEHIDGLCGTIKGVIFGLVKSNKIMINTKEEFANGGFKGFAVHLPNLPNLPFPR